MQTFGQLTIGQAALGGRIRQTSPWRQALASLKFGFEVQRQRHALSTLTRRDLADIGLTPEKIRYECAKPFCKSRKGPATREPASTRSPS
jgi:uncharacterized protein YjiS (DUF1127 family)